MIHRRNAALAARFADLLQQFLPEIKKTEWGPALRVADARGQQEVCGWLADAWESFRTLLEDDELPSAQDPEALDPALLETDAGAAGLVILVWLMFLNAETMANGGVLPQVDADMWTPNAKGPEAGQFFSNPGLPAQEDMLQICAGVRAKLPEGQSLPASAFAILQSPK